MASADRRRERIRQEAALNNGITMPVSVSPSTVTTPTSPATSLDAERKVRVQRERERLVLWRSPFRTMQYFLLELMIVVKDNGRKLVRQTKLMISLALLITTLLLVYYINGPHQSYVRSFNKQFLWCSYWVGLGVLSSVGLGTGLHTFVLYLGPHIASVTLAAFECMSVDFPEPPYPDDIICPDKAGVTMSLWSIISKVRLEAFMWGAGTAIGELPPYFMARASRLSGDQSEDDELSELTADSPSTLGVIGRAKLVVHRLVHRVGFAGIFLCASIPNPLFDLAGITCGHFLVPFWTFFGATLLGKAVVKMHIQKLFVIFLFSEKHVEGLVKMIGSIPRVGKSIQAPFKEYLAAQKLKMHRGKVGDEGKPAVAGDSWLSAVFEKVIIVMVAYFILSIINSFAQSYHKRLTEAEARKKKVSD